MLFKAIENFLHNQCVTTTNILFSQAEYPDSSIHSVVEGVKDERVQLTAVTKIREITISVIGSSEESGATACVFRHVRRYNRFSQLTGSRFPVNRRSFRTYHLVEATSILPAL